MGSGCKRVLEGEGEGSRLGFRVWYRMIVVVVVVVVVRGLELELEMGFGVRGLG